MINKKVIGLIGIPFLLCNCIYFSLEIYKEVVRRNLSIAFGKNIEREDYLRLNFLNELSDILGAILIVLLLTLFFWFNLKKEFVYSNYLISINIVVSILFLILSFAVSAIFNFAIGNLTQFHYTQLILTIIILIIQKIWSFSKKDF
ncbi:hypothetical protein [Amphibacillus jilinensis]|uniref:hypothetical protein n=1 Tax=Amphibacillus jilinensis TaxID=1216008 RepID=UPI000372B09E|nr:hypothetical protein [Amphibacillus jilinensis]